MTNDKSNSKFNLEDRTAVFGENTLMFCKQLRVDDIDKILLNQLVRSATSIGANYMEANGADSKKDFKNKISLCKKEAKETMHWLRMLAKVFPEDTEYIRKLWQEAKELSLIFGAINRK